MTVGMCWLLPLVAAIGDHSEPMAALIVPVTHKIQDFSQPDFHDDFK